MGDKQEKQNYLKINILNEGYDVNEFGMFMASQKQDGTDINNWGFHELELLVDEFKRLQDQKDADQSRTGPNTEHSSHEHESHPGEFFGKTELVLFSKRVD